MSAVRTAPSLDGMTMAGLAFAFDAALAAQDAILGVYNQPRTIEDGAAHSWIEEAAARATFLAQQIAQEAERRAPNRPDAIRERAAILVRWGLECGSWPDILAAAHIEPVREAAE